MPSSFSAHAATESESISFQLLFLIRYPTKRPIRPISTTNNIEKPPALLLLISFLTSSCKMVRVRSCLHDLSFQGSYISVLDIFIPFVFHKQLENIKVSWDTNCFLLSNNNCWFMGSLWIPPFFTHFMIDEGYKK